MSAGRTLSVLLLILMGRCWPKRATPIGDGLLQAVAVQIYGEVVAEVGAEPDVFGVAALGFPIATGIRSGGCRGD